MIKTEVEVVSTTPRLLRKHGISQQPLGVFSYRRNIKKGLGILQTMKNPTPNSKPLKRNINLFEEKQ